MERQKTSALIKAETYNCRIKIILSYCPKLMGRSPKRILRNHPIDLCLFLWQAELCEFGLESKGVAGWYWIVFTCFWNTKYPGMISLGSESPGGRLQIRDLTMVSPTPWQQGYDGPHLLAGASVCAACSPGTYSSLTGLCCLLQFMVLNEMNFQY
jgi:hypothetical protein